jgi:hypothetical protein
VGTRHIRHAEKKIDESRAYLPPSVRLEMFGGLTPTRCHGHEDDHLHALFTGHVRSLSSHRSGLATFVGTRPVPFRVVGV